MVACQAFLAVQFVTMLITILASIVIARKEDRVRHMLPQAARYFNELDEPDDQGIRIFGPLRAEPTLQIGLYDLRLL
jgi:hypothetical protein